MQQAEAELTSRIPKKSAIINYRGSSSSTNIFYLEVFSEFEKVLVFAFSRDSATPKLLDASFLIRQVPLVQIDMP
jgi:hypothetical protein